MKLSIFKEVIPHPKSPEEKKKGAFKSRRPTEVSFKDEQELLNLVTTYAWSPSIFRGTRSNDNFVSADLMVLDIDKNLRMEEAEKRCEQLGLCHIIIPSPSFTENNHKYRVIFPLVKTILSKEIFDNTWEYLKTLFPECDIQCSDYARFYYASSLIAGSYGEGNLLIPIELNNVNNEYENDIHAKVEVKDYSNLEPLKILYDEVPRTIPKRIDDFLKNAHTGLEGAWIMTLNACVFSLGLQGIQEDRIWSAIEAASPEELDNRDIDTIKRAIRDGYSARKVAFNL